MGDRPGVEVFEEYAGDEDNKVSEFVKAGGNILLSMVV